MYVWVDSFSNYTKMILGISLYPRLLFHVGSLRSTRSTTTTACL